MDSITNAVEKMRQAGSRAYEVGSLLSSLKRLTDKRKRRGIRYRLEVVVLLFILAKLCGQDKPYAIADWVQQRKEALISALKLERTTLPHHSTVRRILAEVIDGEELEQVIDAYLAEQMEQGQEVVIVLDGKTLRGTITAENPFGVHLLAAYLPEQGIVLTQMEVEQGKENEIPVAARLLSQLDLRGKVVIADALHAQRQLSVQIHEGGGHFVWLIKDNQPKTRQAIEQLFTPSPAIPGLGCPRMDFCRVKTVDKQAGRIEERTLTVSQLLNDYLDWPYVQQVFKLERRFSDLATGKVQQQIEYGLTDLPADQAPPERLLEIVRSLWGIENGLHYRRDVTFQEDRTRMTQPSMGRAMAIINNLIISLLNLKGFRNHAQARRRFDAHPHEAIALIGGL